MNLAAAYLSVIGLSALPALALAQEVDPRALESCARDGASFVAIAKCLPEEHVGLQMLDTIARDSFFGAAGTDLSERCLGLNDGKYTGAWSCASSAIDAAVQLGHRLPKGSRIDDPLFNGLNRPELMARLEESEKAAKALFPEKTLWGGNMYRALK
ncbi:hypothetical protein [Pseudooceanicola sp.]|uniref:hypothetical protein n=1 Tax=Pseudooceanicola sp. TaxID=1914328 RepID=UPI0026103D55|nr:hypothetical protein [Pseudooceanicola sp.]MDF1856717.1 hypothetical protein [Pseudooceanicola sp.]